ncbi:response regulator transcription factor, partial [Ferrovum sp.]|uniref:LuxR C-terminal-related transcriptional regulator n=1 Tax=Ferrovum sp. TaxID=2609467 RepID=UPI00260F501C
MVSVALVDSSPVVTLGLPTLLAPFGVAVGVASNSLPDQALGVVDVVVVDPVGMRGFRTIDQIMKRYSSVPVLVYTADPSQPMTVSMLRSGVIGVVDKNDPIDEIVSAICLACKGKRYVSKAQADFMADLVCSGKSNPNELSAREAEVATLARSGLATKEIASKLGLSYKTVASQK